MKHSRVFNALCRALFKSAVTGSLVISHSSLASEPESQQDDAFSSIEVISITSTSDKNTKERIYLESPSKLATSNQHDVGQWLNVLPGSAAVNNGPISSIAQYRGYSGKRMGVIVNDQFIQSAGPNAMDAPMSYGIAGAIDNVTVYRGIAPVSVFGAGLGGAIKISQGAAQFADSKESQFNGSAFAQVSQQTNDMDLDNSLTASFNIANDTNAFRGVSSFQKGDNLVDGDGVAIENSFYQRNQTRLEYAFRTNLNLAEDIADTYRFAFQRTNTNESGTPALPMDIDYIDTDQVSIRGNTMLSLGNWVWSLSAMDGEHGMSNYSLRNAMPNMLRYNTASIDALSFTSKLVSQVNQKLRTEVGFMHHQAEHNSTITSPGNPMFNITNFNGVDNKDTALFADLNYRFTTNTAEAEQFSLLNLGVKVTQHTTDANEVSHHMAMMNPNIMALQNQFNDNIQQRDELLLDFVASIKSPVTEHISTMVSVGQKERAPTYQERYLWVPMQSTGGLADGNTYIGNQTLNPETAHQINVGLEYADDLLTFSPQVFYHSIDDFITATPSTSMPANMVANMMTGQAPLAFGNVDATIWGTDILFDKIISPSFRVSGSVSMVRGSRDDINDDLYRISSDRLVLVFHYQFDDIELGLQQSVHRGQKRVSQLVQESPSSGYALTNLYASTEWQNALIKVGIDNLFDRQYYDHLSGRYRPMMGSHKQGEIIPGSGRQTYLSISYSF